MKPSTVNLIPTFGLFLLSVCAPLAFSATDLKPQAGETKLDAAATQQVTAALEKTFKENPNVTADMEVKIDDFIEGMKSEKGKQILQRPDNLLRWVESAQGKKLSRLMGDKLREYNPISKNLTETDFSQAPEKLAKYKGALVGDLNALQQEFDLTIFEKEDAGKKHYRLVLTPKKSSKLAEIYTDIQVHVAADSVFFNEIHWHYKEGKGDTMIEVFSNFKVEKEIPAKAFANENLDGKLNKPATMIKDD